MFDFRVACLTVILISCCGCIDFGPSEPDSAKKPQTPAVKVFDSASCSNALAELVAVPCDENDSRFATDELDGVLTILERDGHGDYVQRVRKAVPAIGGKEARDLTDDEMKALRGVK